MSETSSKKKSEKILRFVDLFCGIGGFRFAMGEVAQKRKIKTECVFSCDIDANARKAYEANFGHAPNTDITLFNENDIPDCDLLFAGFPCQPFSIIGKRKGFEDTRGTLFFEIARILQKKRPAVFVLENVKQLVRHQNGATFERIVSALKDMDYRVEYRVLNALDFGLPQKRERVFIVGVKDDAPFDWPEGNKDMRPLHEFLEPTVEEKHFANSKIQDNRIKKHRSAHKPGIWHENKSGNVTSYPYACALRAGASYNYLLVDGQRRLTPREMLRLQGFPGRFKIVCSDYQTRKQAGNAVAVPVVAAILDALVHRLLNPAKPPGSTDGTDCFSTEDRSRIMRSVKSRGNRSTELGLTAIFREKKITGWRRGYKLLGKPDFVFPAQRIALFADGCFWHGHPCRNITPRQNAEYWQGKIKRNKKRDKEVTKQLEDKGWNVVRIFECKIRKKQLPRKFLQAFKSS